MSPLFLWQKFWQSPSYSQPENRLRFLRYLPSLLMVISLGLAVSAGQTGGLQANVATPKVWLSGLEQGTKLPQPERDELSPPLAAAIVPTITVSPQPLVGADPGIAPVGEPYNCPTARAPPAPLIA